MRAEGSRTGRWWLAAVTAAVALWPAAARADERAPGTVRMAARLAQLIPQGNPGVNPTVGCDFRIAWFARQRDQAGDLRSRLNATLPLGWELLNCGRTEEATREFLAVREGLEQPQARPDAQSLALIRNMLAMSYLRLGEQDNCMARHGPQACLLPIEGGGVHSAQRGSRSAIAELTAQLEESPRDLAAVWLLNVAYMTVGEYPSGVPRAFLIPPEVFSSEYDIGRFPNVASRLGLDVFGLSGGVVFEDLDGDGDLDVMVSGWGIDEQTRLFRNDGGGTFSERTREAGLVGEVGGLNLCHADYDNDGDADVLVLRGAWLRADGHHPNSLFRNEGDGTFADATEEAGLLSFHPTQTAAWGDFDNDGWLDLFIGNESTEGEPNPCELYRNNGDGTFTDVAAAAGVDHVGFVKGVAAGDYDNDGRLDLYLSRLGEPNVLYHNLGPGSPAGVVRFADVSRRAGVTEPLTSFPTWFFDYDNDGWLDLFVAPFPGFSGDTLAQIAADYLGATVPAAKPRLYRNNGDGTFSDVAAALGLDDAMLAMGANFGDLDNDGFLDIAIGTGEPNLRTLVPNRVYRNDGGRRFWNVTFSGGFGHLQKGHGIAFGDLDNDGDQDLYAVMGGAYTGDLAYNALFLNPGHGNHWLTLMLAGVRSNRAGIGSRIAVAVEDQAGARRVIHVTCGTGGSFGSSSLRQEIGLGRARAIESIEVLWPASGRRQRFERVEMDRAWLVREDAEALEPVPLGGFKLD